MITLEPFKDRVGLLGSEVPTVAISSEYRLYLCNQYLTVQDGGRTSADTFKEQNEVMEGELEETSHPRLSPYRSKLTTYDNDATSGS